MNEIETGAGHIPGRCLSDSQKCALLAELVTLLLAPRPDTCPACLIETLQALVDEAGELWRAQVHADDGPQCWH